MAGWQPIETAPKDGTRVKLRFATGLDEEGTFRTTYGGEWHVKSFTHLPWANEPTHWMPLPEPPADCVEE